MSARWHISEYSRNGRPKEFERSTAFTLRDGDCVEVRIRRNRGVWVADPVNEIGAYGRFDTARAAMDHIDAFERASEMAHELGFGVSAGEEAAS